MNTVTFTEREAIRKMLDYIEKERERLFSQSISLLDRLHELDKIEIPGIGSGLPQGKLEMLPEESKTIVVDYSKTPLGEAITKLNEKEEEGKAELLDDSFKKHIYDIPMPTPTPTQIQPIPMQVEMPFMPNYKNYEPCNLVNDDVVAKLAEKPMSLMDMVNVISEERAEEIKAFIPKTEIEAQKDKDEKKKAVRPSSYRDVKVITQYIKAILKEAGVPIRTAELIKRLGETGIDVSSPYVLLQQAAQYDPKIQRPKHGFYQYNFSA